MRFAFQSKEQGLARKICISVQHFLENANDNILIIPVYLS